MLPWMFLLILLPLISGEERTLPWTRRKSLDKLECTSKILEYDGQFMPIITEKLFAECDKLEYLFLTDNFINLIEKQSFGQLINLKSINLSSNAITKLPNDIFFYAPNLEEVKFSNNLILYLQSYLFLNLPHLKYVDFQFNNISYIRHNCFAKVPSLVAINLGNNNLKTLQLNMIDDSRNLKALYLVGNPWHCDTSLCEFMHTVVTRFWQEPFGPICHSPNGTRGASWKQVIDLSLPGLYSNVRDNPYTDNVLIQCHICNGIPLSWEYIHYESLFLNAPGLNSPMVNELSRLPDGPKKNVTNEATQVIGKYFTLSTLTINNFGKSNDGYYTCYLKNCSSSSCNSSTYLYMYSQLVYGYPPRGLGKTIPATTTTRVITWVLSITIVVSAVIYFVFFYGKSRMCGQNESGSVFSQLRKN